MMMRRRVNGFTKTRGSTTAAAAGSSSELAGTRSWVQRLQATRGVERDAEVTREWRAKGGRLGFWIDLAATSEAKKKRISTKDFDCS